MGTDLAMTPKKPALQTQIHQQQTHIDALKQMMESRLGRE